jgi:glycosyltransferase involved in cell wall biosynthesis
MSEPRALILITTSFPIAGDGSEAAGSFVSDLAEELAKHLPVRVVAPGTQTQRESWADGVEIFRFAAPAKPLSTLKPWNPSDLLALRQVLATGEAATRDAVAAGPTAHLLALWALPSGHWARRVSRNTGVPYSVWTLGSDIWTLGRIPLVRGHLRRVLRDAHTCYSDGLKLAEDTRCIGGREVGFLPSTRRIERRRSAPLKSAPPYRLLFLGRWHPNKGVDLLIDALKLLHDEDWRRIEAVEICGGGPLEPLVRAGVQQLRDAGRSIELRGYLDKAAAEETILRADYLLIPSRIESIPVVFSDAMKLGCPVLASPVGDLPRLVGEAPQCGLVARTVAANAYADTIVHALRQSAVGFADGVAAMAERFGMDALARGLAIGPGGEHHE